MRSAHIQNEANVKENSRLKKVAWIVVLLLLGLSILTVGVIAYFSDLTIQTAEVNVGTLKISGEYTIKINGVDTTFNDIKNLNPGDVIVIKANIANNGSKSAWIREKISLTSVDSSVLDYFEIYVGEFSQTTLINEDLSQYVLATTDGESVSSNRVINGSGEAAEVEEGADYVYIGESSYEVVYTIYFVPSAPNAAQGKKIDFTICTQALQFRNNNFTEPAESAWATVVAA